MVVLTDIMVDTNVLIWVKLGFCNFGKTKTLQNAPEEKLNRNPVTHIQMQSFSSDAIQRCVIKHNDAISTAGQSTKRE